MSFATSPKKFMSERGDSNARPLRPERSALPTALLSDCTSKVSDFLWYGESVSLLFRFDLNRNFREVRIVGDE